MSRLFICGITCGPEIDKIKELVERTKDYVDGFIWTVDSMSIWSIELIDFLEKNKKSGKIISFPWSNQHDMQAQIWLTCGALKEGDWVWMFDSSESPTDFWLNGITKLIEESKKNNISSYYCSGRPYLFRYSEYCYFHGTPHWGLYGLPGNLSVTIKEEDKSQFIINKRDLNPAKHYQEHDTKYYLYGRSNIIDAFYGKYGQNVVDYHESIRREFRKYLRKNYGEPNLKTLDDMFNDTLEWPDNDFVVDVIETEFCLSEYYRRIVLKEDFMKDIVPRRERWSFLSFIKNGNGFLDPNYLGTRLKYDKQFNDFKVISSNERLKTQ